MNYKIHFYAILIASFIPFRSFSQNGVKVIENAKVGTVNMKAVMEYETLHPPNHIAKKIPGPKKIKPVIANSVDENTPVFSGKISAVSLKESKVQRTAEFPCVNFNAIDNNSGGIPPDVNGSVGFDHIVTTLNTHIRVQNKQGGILSTVSLAGFWNGAGGHTDIFDPKITYDPYGKRWTIVSCATRNAAASSLLIAVSTTPDPMGDWSVYNIDADGNDLFWLDYPSLGFNNNWIAVGGYLFNIPGFTNTQFNRMWVFNKAELYAGANTISFSFFDRTDYFHIAPAITYSPTENTIWCVSMHNSNFNNNGFVRLFSITGTPAAPVFNVLNAISVGGAWATGGVTGPQSGSGTGMDLGDHRIMQTVFRNGVLWTSQNIFLPAITPTTCASQIVAINTATQTAIENIRTATDANNMTGYPSVTVNKNNDLFFGYTTFSTTQFARATISYRRAGEGFFFYHYKNGEDWYVKLDPTSGLNRWGDYTATYIDPEDDITAWTVQEYARPRVGPNSFWGTWWAKVCPGTCDNDYFLFDTYNNVMRKYEANNTITSIGQVQGNSNIKYDAGTRITLSPGFRVFAGGKFRAYIEGCGGAR